MPNLSKRQNEGEQDIGHFGFEILEPRVLLDGNVEAVLAGGNLRITGDALDNRLEIDQIAPNTFIVSGLATTVNGQAVETFINVTRGITVKMKDGNDNRRHKCNCLSFY